MTNAPSLPRAASLCDDIDIAFGMVGILDGVCCGSVVICCVISPDLSTRVGAIIGLCALALCVVLGMCAPATRGVLLRRVQREASERTRKEDAHG